MQFNAMRMMIRITAMLMAALVASTTANAQGDSRYIEYRRLMTAEVIERLSKDLSLSEEQRATLISLHKTYLNSLERGREALENTTRQNIQALRLKHMPELDPAINLDDLPADRRHEVQIARMDQERGSDPLIRNNEYVFELNIQSTHNIDAVNALELDARRQLFESLIPALAEVQVARLPRAMRRVVLNMYAFSRIDPIESDPRVYIDVLGLIDDASKPERELSLWRAVLADGPFSEAPDDVSRAISQVVENLETAAAAAIDDIEARHGEHFRPFYEARAMKDDAKAASVLRQYRARYKLLFAIRIQFASEVFNLASQHLNENAAHAWMKRFKVATCPKLYANDSVDEIVGWLSKLQIFDDETAQTCATIYESYTGWREPVREKVFNLEIETYGSFLDYERKAYQPLLALDEINNTRKAKAAEAHGQLRALLEPDLQVELDRRLKEFAKGTRLSVDVIP